MRKSLLLFFTLLTGFITANAQLTESFDDATFPPAGWTSTVIATGTTNGQSALPGSTWVRATTTTNPAAAPHSGAGMALYNSYDFHPGSKADLITPAIDFTGGEKRVSFWMYRSSTYSDQDSITVHVNTSNTGTGATRLGKIIRFINSAPVESTIGWYQYFFDIPASFNGAANYIIFRAHGQYGLNMLIDDILVANQPSCKIPTDLTVSNFNFGAGTATATWTPPTGSPVDYQWAVNTTGIAPASGTTATGTTTSITGITPNVVNYLFLRTNCGAGGFSAWTSTSFAALPCAILTAPVSGATNTSQSPTFTWDPVAGANSYNFYLGSTPTNGTSLGNTALTSVSISNFLPLTTYYWYVIPVIGTVAAPNGSCPASSFTVGIEANTPANNACSGATTVGAGNIAGNEVTSTTVGSTISLAATPCLGFDSGAPDDDVWFEFTTSGATAAGTLTITPLATGGISDIVAQVYAASSCNGLGAPVTCADLTGAAEPELVDLSLLSPNTHYYMRVYSFTNAPAARGGFTISVSAGNTLPVNLTDFSVRRSNGVNILNWSTQQELNTRHFVVERSTDGVAYTGIGQVAANGNGNVTRRYSYTDNHPVNGINYYRLRAVDNDNSYKFSDIRSIRNEGIADITVYPNPVRERLILSVNADKATSGQVVILDLSGKIVYSGKIKIPQGNTMVPVAADAIASGSYIIKIHLDDKLIVKKFNKL